MALRHRRGRCSLLTVRRVAFVSLEKPLEFSVVDPGHQATQTSPHWPLVIFYHATAPHEVSAPLAPPMSSESAARDTCRVLHALEISKRIWFLYMV